MFFSITITAYNAEKYLNNCIQSILCQSYTDYELILLDDGSKDSSPRICDDYNITDHRNKVIHKKNEGANNARNMGIFAAKGEYICLVGSDDTVSDLWLKMIRDIIDSSSEKPDLVIYEYNNSPEDKMQAAAIDLEEGLYNRDRLEKEVFPFLLNKSDNFIWRPLIIPAPWNRVYKKELLQEHCCQDKQIKVANDCAFTYECALYAESIYMCHAKLYNYASSSENSLQHSYHANLFQNYTFLFQYMKKHLESLHSTMPRQLKAFFAGHIKIAFNQELVYNHHLLPAARNIRKELNKSGILKFVSIKGLPFKHKLWIILLRMRMCLLCLVIQKELEEEKKHDR